MLQNRNKSRERVKDKKNDGRQSTLDGQNQSSFQKDNRDLFRNETVKINYMSNLIRDILGLRDPLALLPTHPEVVKSRSSPWNWRFELQNVKIRSQLLREHKFAAFGTVTCSTVMADCKIYFDQNFYRRQPLCSLPEPKRSSLGRTMQCKRSFNKPLGKSAKK